METAWNYTDLADAYLKRPDYAQSAINEIVGIAGVGPGSDVCDVGAGVAHLTLMLAGHGLNVTAVEPNDAMRANGVNRTTHLDNVTWFEGVGEDTGRPSGAYELVTFGSSFNVTDRQAALLETARILRPGGHFACMWNHRDLEDPVQKSIEDIIKSNIAEYGYGSRREDQTDIINASGLFGTVQHVQGTVQHEQSVGECVEAWRSHATLERQAGDVFPQIVNEIESMLQRLGTDTITIPYMTRAWTAHLK